MSVSLLATSNPSNVIAMRAQFHSDRERNHPRRIAIARTMRVLCAPIDWWRVYGETFAEVIRPTGKRL